MHITNCTSSHICVKSVPKQCVTLFKSEAHLKVDARGPLVSRLVPGFPARLLNSGKIRCSFEELLSQRKTFEGPRPPWASWLLCLAILKSFFSSIGSFQGQWQIASDARPYMLQEKCSCSSPILPGNPGCFNFHSAPGLSSCRCTLSPLCSAYKKNS